MLLAIALLLCWCADYEFVRCKRDEYDRALGRAGKMSAGVHEGQDAFMTLARSESISRTFEHSPSSHSTMTSSDLLCPTLFISLVSMGDAWRSMSYANCKKLWYIS